MKNLGLGRPVLMALSVWFVASCAQTPVSLTDTAPQPKERFRQSKSADAVLRFFSWDTIYLTRPDTRREGFLPILDRDAAARQVADRTSKRDLAVIIIGYLYSPEQQAELIHDWDSILSQLRFQRVVVLRADRQDPDRIDGLPILNDSAIAAQRDQQAPSLTANPPLPAAPGENAAHSQGDSIR